MQEIQEMLRQAQEAGPHPGMGQMQMAFEEEEDEGDEPFIEELDDEELIQ